MEAAFRKICSIKSASEGLLSKCGIPNGPFLQESLPYPLLHQCPRSYGKATSIWTLPGNHVCKERKLTEQQASIETIRLALKRLGVGWQRAKHWITSPDPDYARKKHRRDALLALAERCGWIVGFEDEVWWSRVAQPSLHAWSEAKQSLRLLERSVSKEDPDPKALCCYGMLQAYNGTLQLRFVEGRPVSQVTTDFLEWLCHQFAEAGQRKFVLVWDNARLSCQQTGEALDPSTQSAGTASSARREKRHPTDPLLAADQESLAQSDRATLGSWQASHC